MISKVLGLLQTLKKSAKPFIMSIPTSWNTNVFQVPHKEGTWKELGFIIGENPNSLPLFRMSGNDIITWKEYCDKEPNKKAHCDRTED